VLQPGIIEIAVPVPLQGIPVVTLYPIADPHPEGKVGMVEQGWPFTVLYPAGDVQPEGRAWAFATLTKPKEKTPPTTNANIRNKVAFFINLIIY
jgi:hypothetical protein